MEIKGKIVDVTGKRIFPGSVVIKGGRIVGIKQIGGKVPDRYIMPGFIDAHVHIESSMLTPVRFAELAMRQGTVGIVTDPHEIANVLGTKGIRYMMAEAERTPMKIKFGIPSCVPATPYETSGAVIDAKEIEEMMRENTTLHLSEMMNFPGVIYEDEEVMKKLEVARKYGRVVDGHAPGLRGENLEKYVRAGISTDHECTDIEEAVEKIQKGMMILIREGSAAKNFEELIPLLKKYPEKVMFCTDDSHPDDLAEKHIRELVRRAVAMGYDLWDVLTAAIINPVKFYGLNVGLLQEGDPGDFIVVEDLKDFRLKEVYINGERVYDGKGVKGGIPGKEEPNKFVAEKINEVDIKVNAKEGKRIRVITAKDGSLVTGEIIAEPRIEKGLAVSDPEKDILKIVVMNRYKKEVKPVCGFVRGFGLKRGAFAGSIAHDSHNIIAVGASDASIVKAINSVISVKGGIAVVNENKYEVLALPVAGLMTHVRGDEVAKKYKEMNKRIKELGTGLAAPFMTLSFMALLVIPQLKIGDKGLFDVRNFDFAELFI